MPFKNIDSSKNNLSSRPQKMCDRVRDYIETVIGERVRRLDLILERAKSSLEEEEFIGGDDYGSPIDRAIIADFADFLVGTYAMLDGLLISICLDVAPQEYEIERAGKGAKHWSNKDSRKVLKDKFHVTFSQEHINKLWGDSSPEWQIRNAIAHNSEFIQDKSEYVWREVENRSGYSYDDNASLYDRYCRYIVKLGKKHLSDVMDRIDAASSPI